MSTRLYATYDEPEQLVAAVSKLRALGYARLEAYTPYPIVGLPEALGCKPSPIPLYCFIVAVLAVGVTYWIQWLLQAYLYPIDVGARPAHFPLAYVPICFEMGVLFASLTAVIAIAVKGQFGKLWQPVFEVPHFSEVTRDGYWLELALAESQARDEGEAALRETGASDVMAVAR